MDWIADTEFRLVVVGSERDLESVAEPFDTVVAGEHGVDIRQLIEDELLGSLPLAPMHASAAECEPMAEAVVEAKPDAALQDTNRPFAGLDALLKGVNK